MRNRDKREREVDGGREGRKIVYFHHERSREGGKWERMINRWFMGMCF